jgi:hypothetical protein
MDPRLICRPRVSSAVFLQSVELGRSLSRTDPPSRSVCTFVGFVGADFLGELRIASLTKTRKNTGRNPSPQNWGAVDSFAKSDGLDLIKFVTGIPVTGLVGLAFDPDGRCCTGSVQGLKGLFSSFCGKYLLEKSREGITAFRGPSDPSDPVNWSEPILPSISLHWT